MPRDIDIDALLGKGGLRFTLGGQQYDVADVPVSVLLETQQEQAEGRTDVRQLLGRLVPGLDGEALEKIGAKAAAIILREITDFFAEATAEAQATAGPAAPTGSEPSVDSSDSTEPIA